MSRPMCFKTLDIVREHLLREINGLSREQLLEIPEGRDDNVLWNVGHLLCSLSRLTYGRTGHPLPIPKRYLELMGKNTNALDWPEPPDVDTVIAQFKTLPAQIEHDYAAGEFPAYEPLQITPAHTIDSLEEAVNFHCFHEGLHIGMIITLKQRLGLATTS